MNGLGRYGFFYTCVAGLVFTLAVGWAGPARAHLLGNGGFEEGLIGWSSDSSFAPAELSILTGQAGREVFAGGKALQVLSAGPKSALHQRGGTAGIDYELSFHVRAGIGVKAADGTAVAPKIGVGVFAYGRPEVFGYNGFLATIQKLKMQPVADAWREVRLPLKVDEAEIAGVRTFNVVLFVEGAVVLDEVVLRETETWREALLFHLPFDENLAPAVAVGPAAGETVGQVRLVGGRRGKAGSFTEGAYLAFPAEDNFDQGEGTVALWVKPYWPEHDGAAHCFIEVPGPGAQAANPDAAFAITKGWTDQNTPNDTYCHISTAAWGWGPSTPAKGFNFIPNEWVHIAFTWSASGGVLKLYRNGELFQAVKQPFGAKPSTAGRRLLVGARHAGRSPADAAIDELMVFGRALSDGEVARLTGASAAAPTAAPTAAEKLPSLDSRSVNIVEMGWETPHIPFSRPAASGPLRPLFIVAQADSREVVELAQRFAMDFAAVVVQNRSKFGFDTAYQQKWGGISTADKRAELAACLDARPELLAVCDFDWAKLPAALAQRILDMVGAGMGLVLINPVHPPLAGLAEVSDGRTAILYGVPLAALSDAWATEKPVAADIGAKSVLAYRHGQGRVAVITWRNKPVYRESGITPRAASGVVERQFEHRCNYYFSAIGKALYWAAGRAPRIEWSALPADGAVFAADVWPADGVPVQFLWHGPDGTAAVLKATIRDAAGRIQGEASTALRLSAGTNAASVKMPMPKAGPHYLDLALLTEGEVENWATVFLNVERPEEIVVFGTGSRYGHPGEAMACRIELRAPLTAAADLALRATDTCGREHARLVRRLDAGTSVVDCALPLATPATIASYVEAEILRDGQVLAGAETVIFVPRASDREFMAMIWGWPQSGTLTQYRILQRIREAGFNAANRYGYAGDYHNEGMADIVPVQDVCRLIIRSTPHSSSPPGWMNISSLWLKQNYGFDDPDHSLGNPALRKVLREDVVAVARAGAALGAWWYNLGDENFMMRDFGYSPFGMVYFAGFLERRHGTIGNLNREYGADFAGFTDVPRYRAGGSVVESSMPALLDHELCMDDEWAALHQLLADGIREIDPRARVGAEGSHPGDMERILQGVQVWAPYAGQGELLRSLGPETFRSHWWGSYYNGGPHAGLLWSWLIQGKANFHQWWCAFVGEGAEGIFNANLTYRDYFKNLLPDLNEIHGGIGMLLAGARVVSDREVVLHYSRASFHAGQRFGRLARASSSDKALTDMLTSIGQDFRYASSRLIQDGRLLAPRAQVLFLPASYCMSTAEAQGIAEFVRQGGMVVADVVPGILNEFGRRLPAGQLDEVFGIGGAVDIAPRILEDAMVTGDLWGKSLSLGLGAAFCNGAVTLTTGRPVSVVEGVPLLIANRYGQGRAILLNFDLARIPKAMATQLMRTILTVAGVRPEFRLEGVTALQEPRDGGGAVMLRNIMAVLRRGDVTLVGAVLPGKDVDPRPEIVWDAPAHTYNIRTGEYLGHVNRVCLNPWLPTEFGERAQAHLLSLHAGPVKGISIAAPAAISPGAALPVAITMDLGRGAPKDRLLRIEVFDPAGRDVTCLRGFLTLEAATGHWTLPFAFNDPLGQWTVRVTDLATGVFEDCDVQLKQAVGR